MRRRAEAQDKVVEDRPSLRHDLPLADWDVVISFADGTRAVVPTQARHPISAVRLASYGIEREWPAERLLAVRTMQARMRGEADA